MQRCKFEKWEGYYLLFRMSPTHHLHVLDVKGCYLIMNSVLLNHSSSSINLKRIGHYIAEIVISSGYWLILSLTWCLPWSLFGDCKIFHFICIFVLFHIPINGRILRPSRYCKQKLKCSRSKPLSLRDLKK